MRHWRLRLLMMERKFFQRELRISCFFVTARKPSADSILWSLVVHVTALSASQHKVSIVSASLTSKKGRPSQTWPRVLGYSSSMCLFSIIVHVSLCGLQISLSTCMMIVPVQFADVEVWLSGAACLFPCWTESMLFFFMDLEFISFQAVPMNAVLRIGNKSLCESVALSV